MPIKKKRAKEQSTRAPPRPPYEPTDQDRAVVGKLPKNKSSMRLKVTNHDASQKVTMDHPDQNIGRAYLMEALATTDFDFANGIIEQLANADKKGGKLDERQVNFLLSVIKGIAPRDQLETMLAAQMATVHIAIMSFSRHFALIETLPQQDSAERAFNKLARTFLAQMAGLKHYRTGGEQKVTVQHVSVSEGGQAIVGNVTQTSGEKSPESVATSTPAITHAKTAPMTIIGEKKEATALSVRRRREK